MTMKPKAHKFRIRRNSQTEPTRRSVKPDEMEDGFGDAPFPGSAKAEANADTATQGIAEIRREGLTGRQLRMARRLAQKHGLAPNSDFDAVRLLRARGIDPFDRANMLELVHARSKPQTETSADKSGAKSAPETPNLPQTVEDPSSKVPGAPGRDDPLRLHELERIQRDIVGRRRRNIAFLVARLSVFVVLPTFLSWIYFAFAATPSYATKSEFVVQQADVAAQGGGSLLGGTAMATSQDSIMVQDFLTSREAMLRLDEDHGYRLHFSDQSIDALQRVPSDASNEDLYKHYQNNVTLGYDPTEGVLRMEVSALSPEMSRVFSEALIGYAEDRVDSITERKRDDQMRGARESFEEAEIKMVAAQERVLALQEQLGVVDPASETSALMGQISTFETQLAERRLQLQQLLDNERPNQARVAGAQGDISRLEDLIDDLRSDLTEAGTYERSLASMSAELRMAEVDLETRTMMMQESLQQMEAARIEAMRQVRFLSLGVAPIPPDEPTYPRVFENTMIALFIFSAIYLIASITIGILRDQVSS